MVGISGGVDSTWLLHLLVKEGLRPYVYHVDTGWNTQKAISNIYRICSSLDVKIHTHVVDWTMFKKLQQAYFYLGVLNQDVPQDIAIFSSQIERCHQLNIGCIASGANNTTESILPASWGHHWHDLINLNNIYSAFWGHSLSTFPYAEFTELASFRLGYSQQSRITSINILDFIDYSKTSAVKILKDAYGYQQYEQKHGESAWTLYYQTIYLPSVYKIDKRKAHLSNLIVNREITRDAALSLLSNEPIDSATKVGLVNLISSKLGIPFNHALEPGRYVLPTAHSLFSDTKSIIDRYTANFYSYPGDKKDDIFNEYILQYANAGSKSK